MQELDERISKHYLSALGTAVEAHLGTIWAILVGMRSRSRERGKRPASCGPGHD